MIVVDASALLEVILRTSAAEAIERQAFKRRETLHAPHLIDVEVLQALRRYVASDAIEAQRGSDAMEDLCDFPLRRYPHDFLLPRVWELRNNFTCYDAVYVALAEVLGARFLTRDQRLAAATNQFTRVKILS